MPTDTPYSNGAERQYRVALALASATSLTRCVTLSELTFLRLSFLVYKVKVMMAPSQSAGVRIK